MSSTVHGDDNALNSNSKESPVKGQAAKESTHVANEKQTHKLTLDQSLIICYIIAKGFKFAEVASNARAGTAGTLLFGEDTTIGSLHHHCRTSKFVSLSRSYKKFIIGTSREGWKPIPRSFDLTDIVHKFGDYF